MSRRLRKRFIQRTDRNTDRNTTNTSGDTDTKPDPDAHERELWRRKRNQLNIALDPAAGFIAPIKPTITYSAEVMFDGLTRKIYAAPSSIQVSTVRASERPPFPRIYFNTQSILRSPHAILIACMQPDLGDCLGAGSPLTSTAAEQYCDVLTGHALVVDDCYWLSVLHEHARNERVELAGAQPDLTPITEAIEEMRDQVTTQLRNWGCMVTL